LSTITLPASGPKDVPDTHIIRVLPQVLHLLNFINW